LKEESVAAGRTVLARMLCEEGVLGGSVVHPSVLPKELVARLSVVPTERCRLSLRRKVLGQRCERRRNDMRIAVLATLVLLDAVVSAASALLTRIVFEGLELCEDPLVFVLDVLDLILQLLELLLQVVDAEVLVDRLAFRLGFDLGNGAVTWSARMYGLLPTLAVQQLLESDLAGGARLWYSVSTACRLSLHHYSLF